MYNLAQILRIHELTASTAETLQSVVVGCAGLIQPCVYIWFSTAVSSGIGL